MAKLYSIPGKVSRNFTSRTLQKPLWDRPNLKNEWGSSAGGENVEA
jgi:hypothetical protein